MNFAGESEKDRLQSFEAPRRNGARSTTTGSVSGLQKPSGCSNSEKTDLRLPATGMVQIVDKAVPGLRPVRPNKSLNIALGIIVGGVVGLFLATAVYALQWRAFRRTAGIPRTPFPPRFRAIVHILIAMVVGLLVGYHSATPLNIANFIVVPLTLLLGAIGSAYIELAHPHTQAAPAAPRPAWLDDASLKQ